MMYYFDLNELVDVISISINQIRNIFTKSCLFIVIIGAVFELYKLKVNTIHYLIIKKSSLVLKLNAKIIQR